MEIWVGAGPGVGADPRLNAEECLLGGMRRWWWSKASRCAAGYELSRSSFEFFSSPKSYSSHHLKRQGLDGLE